MRSETDNHHSVLRRNDNPSIKINNSVFKSLISIRYVPHLHHKIEIMQRLLFSAIILFSVYSNSQDSQGQKVEVEVTNIDNENGQMLVAIYDTEANWLKKPHKGVYGKIENGVSKVTFTEVPDGTYAISTFHDEDDDGELDTFLGIPTEDTGASNNAPARMGPPKWEDAKFEIKGKSIKQSIKL